MGMMNSDGLYWGNIGDELTDDEFEALIRKYQPDSVSIDEQIDQELSGQPPVTLSDDLSQRALDAMRRAAKRRNVQQWIDEAVNNDDHTR